VAIDFTPLRGLFEDALAREHAEALRVADRARMGKAIAFITPERARAFAAGAPFVDFALIPSLAEAFQRKRCRDAIIDHDPGDEDRRDPGDEDRR
jgi:hypothetical protein